MPDGKLKLILTLAVLGMAASLAGKSSRANWRTPNCKGIWHDLSAQVGTKIGLDAQKSDDQFRNSVIRKAAAVGIHLEPDQITVRRLVESEGTSSGPVVYLEANYTARVNLLVYSFRLHFNPISIK